MVDVVLVGCSGPKINVSQCEAQDLYNSNLFKVNIKYAHLLQPNNNFIHIISAKYGVIKLNETIEKYDLSVYDLSKPEYIKWCDGIFDSLNSLYDIDNTNFIFLCGINYYKPYINKLKNHSLPYENKPIGKTIQYASQQIKELTTIKHRGLFDV